LDLDSDSDVVELSREAEAGGTLVEGSSVDVAVPSSAVVSSLVEEISSLAIAA